MIDVYRAALRADQRLSVLRVLESSPRYTANTATIEIALEHIGHPIGGVAVRHLCEWLRDADLVEITVAQDSAQGLLVVKATSLGLDVVRGAVIREGVRRPSP